VQGGLDYVIDIVLINYLPMFHSCYIVSGQKYNKISSYCGSTLITNQLLYHLSYRGIVKYIGFYTNLSIRATFFVPKLWLKIVFVIFLHSFYIVFSHIFYIVMSID